MKLNVVVEICGWIMVFFSKSGELYWCDVSRARETAIKLGKNDDEDVR